MELQKFFHMNGGEDEASYAKNSAQQRLILKQVKPILENCIEELMQDIDFPSCMKVADLGCSAGPNTFLTIEHIIESVDKACKFRNYGQELLLPSIQYFLNDLVCTDFNLVFRRLPEFYEELEKRYGRRQGSCLIAAMPGTYHGRLFPDHSMHFIHSSYCLHFLSQVPKELVTELGIHMNKGSIYCGKKSPPIVRKLYLDQLRQDLSTFLRMRSQEMVPKGQLLITLLRENSEEVDGSNFVYIMETALNELVKEGRIEEEKLNSFNLPHYMPPVHEVKQIIENEGSFQILKIQTFNTLLDASYDGIRTGAADDPVGRANYVAMYLRASSESIFASHFGEAIMDDFYQRFADKLVNTIQMRQGFLTSQVFSLRKD